MDATKLTKISKQLSYVLRHRPDSVGLALESDGWIDVQALLAALQQTGTPLPLGLLEQVVADNDKQRFEFSPDRQKIRARQGHSATVDLGYQPAAPPEVLFHGTATRFLDSILQQGLIKGSRHHVHLSLNEQTARQVGSRHGKPVVLQVDASRMAADGYHFFVTANHVWLTETVPAEYLQVIESQRQ